MPSAIRSSSPLTLGISALVAWLCTYATPASAQEQPAPSPGERKKLHALFNLGVEVGGDPVLEVSYTDGDKATLRAGTGLGITLGGMLEPFGGTTHVPQLQASIGFSFSGLPEASNGTASWLRWPVELLAFYSHRPTYLRIGGGIQYHLSAGVHGDGALAPFSAPFKSSLGWVLQGEWCYEGALCVYGRYTIIEYRLIGTWTHVPGNTIGFGMGLVLPVL
jgi:hypothetical protein